MPWCRPVERLGRKVEDALRLASVKERDGSFVASGKPRNQLLVARCPSVLESIGFRKRALGFHDAQRSHGLLLAAER